VIRVRKGAEKTHVEVIARDQTKVLVLEGGRSLLHEGDGRKMNEGKGSP